MVITFYPFILFTVLFIIDALANKMFKSIFIYSSYILTYILTIFKHQGNKDGTDLYLPENTSFRLYRKINDDAYDAGLFINSTPISEIKLSDFIVDETHLTPDSKVTQENLRFDFNHYQNLTVDEILKIEQIVNEEIKKDHKVNIIETSLEEAKKAEEEARAAEEAKAAAEAAAAAAEAPAEEAPAEETTEA